VATRKSIHIDRSASAWLIGRLLDPEALFIFVAGLDDVPNDATPFDMRGVEFGHHGNDCTFETLLRRRDLADPMLWRIAEIVHEADLDDGRFDAPKQQAWTPPYADCPWSPTTTASSSSPAHSSTASTSSSAAN
jgi:hypothetical protein